MSHPTKYVQFNAIAEHGQKLNLFYSKEHDEYTWSKYDYYGDAGRRVVCENKAAALWYLGVAGLEVPQGCKMVIASASTFDFQGSAAYDHFIRMPK